MFPSAKITEKYSAWYCEVALNGVMKHGFTWRDRYHCLAGTDLACALVDSMQKLLQAITVKPRRKKKFVDNPQYFCYRRPAYQLWIEKQKNPDCVALVTQGLNSFGRCMDIYLVICFWGYFVHFYRNRDHFIALCTLQHQRGCMEMKKRLWKKALRKPYCSCLWEHIEVLWSVQVILI